MANSKNIAALLGPALVAITISETVNVHIWAGNAINRVRSIDAHICSSTEAIMNMDPLAEFKSKQRI